MLVERYFEFKLLLLMLIVLLESVLDEIFVIQAVVSLDLRDILLFICTFNRIFS